MSLPITLTGNTASCLHTVLCVDGGEDIVLPKTSLDNVPPADLYAHPSSYRRQNCSPGTVLHRTIFQIRPKGFGDLRR